MENPEVAQILDEVADLLELKGENPFRIRAYRRAAVTLRDFPKPVDPIARNQPEQLCELPGIGEDLAGKISTIVKSGELPLRRELCRQVPPGLRQLMSVPGCGPKRVMQLHKKLKVACLDDLRRAALHHSIRRLKGFGPKTEDNILRALDRAPASAARTYLAEAQPYVVALMTHLRGCPGIKRIEAAGSYRRRKSTVGDLDVLVTCSGTKQVMARLVEFEGVLQVIARGRTKCSVQLRNGLQVDLRAVPDASFGAALVYFTGSKQHNILIRRLAQQQGLKISEYGVYRGQRRIAGRTEKEVYRSIGLPWIPPELREARNEIQLAQERHLPQLVELADIRGDLHMHTTATDGRSSIEEMILACKERGYKYIAITDHSKRVTMAKGLDARRLRRHWSAIEAAASRVKGITVLRGVEVDILENGELDLPDSVLADADWVSASVHYGQHQSKRLITQRIINAVRHPSVHAICHPTGRLIGKRSPYAVDLDEVMKAAADYGCMLELNAQPSRLDLDETGLAAAKQHGIPIVIGTDAHSTDELRFMEFGVYEARRGGLEVHDVANTRTLAQFLRLTKRSPRSSRTRGLSR
jgi:DNA polymerase (family 10)